METGTSETRVFDRIENFCNRYRVRRLAHGLREFFTIEFRHPKFRSFIAYNCKSIVEVLNSLGFFDAFALGLGWTSTDSNGRRILAHHRHHLNLEWPPSKHFPKLRCQHGLQSLVTRPQKNDCLGRKRKRHRHHAMLRYRRQLDRRTSL